MSKRFAMTGVAGFVAPRHLQAIRETGNELVAACDPFDCVGVLDRYFLGAKFFKEFERFDRHLEKLRRRHVGIDYLSICSPNYLHDAHIRLALRLHADAICEKPLVLSPWNLDALQELEQESGRSISTILQLRLHPTIQELRAKAENAKGRSQVDLSYITTRGPWYFVSWKGNEAQSGGVVMNIGIHFFDMLMWIYGAPRSSKVFLYEGNRASGLLELEHADVRWYLSLDAQDLPPEAAESGQTTYRSVSVGGEELEFSTGFTDLHTRAYAQILAGEGYGIEDARPSIEVVHEIRHSKLVPAGAGEAHPQLAQGA
jgi:UDP-N-acetyl-2-amino-2-deoxyglucuronate dehydrogenase